MSRKRPHHDQIGQDEVEGKFKRPLHWIISNLQSIYQWYSKNYSRIK